MRFPRVIQAALVAGLAAQAAAAATDECAAPLPAPLTLARAEQRMMTCNRDILAAAAALEAAQADLRIARQRPNPTLTLGTSNINPQAGVGAGPLRDKAIDSFVHLEQLIERGGKAELREAQAQANLSAAGADHAEQVRQQRLAVRNAFFDAAAARERERLQREFLVIATQSSAVSRQRLESGDIARAEDNRMRLDAARVANDLLQAEGELRRARAELARLLGAEARAADISVQPEWPESAPVAPAGSPGDRPDVVAARLRVKAAEAGWQLARSIATRDVTVGVQADRWPQSETNLQGTGISYGFTVSVPLHVRHANEGEAARALADLDAARLAQDRALSRAQAEARLAREEYGAARERRQRMERETAPLAHEVADAAELAYRKGASGILDLLDARRSLKAVELDELQARADAGKAWARERAAHETYTGP